MKDALKILVLLFGIQGIAQDNQIHFTFDSPEYESLGEKVDEIPHTYWGVFLHKDKANDTNKVLINKSGIHFLNEVGDKIAPVYTSGSEDNHLYLDGAVYWLFTKNEDGETYTLHQISLVHKQGQSARGFWAEVILPESNLEDFTADCKMDKIKIKPKNGVIALESLNEYFFDYYKLCKSNNFHFKKDPYFHVRISAPECSKKSAVKWLDEAQYETMKINAPSKNTKGEDVWENLKIDATGIQAFFNGKEDQAHYLYKVGDPNYSFQKVKGKGYLMFWKLPDGNYDMVLLFLKGKTATLSHIKHGDHNFYSTSEHKIVKGVTTYLVCNELEKYLLYGMATIGEYTGEKFHW